MLAHCTTLFHYSQSNDSVHGNLCRIQLIISLPLISRFTFRFDMWNFVCRKFESQLPQFQRLTFRETSNVTYFSAEGLVYKLHEDLLLFGNVTSVRLFIYELNDWSLFWMLTANLRGHFLLWIKICLRFCEIRISFLFLKYLLKKIHRLNT